MTSSCYNEAWIIPCFTDEKIMQKRLAIGGENFADMIRRNCYYVDKTDFIKTLMESETRVQVITRPRRFGKTLFMDTLKNFLQVVFKSPGTTDQHKKMFAGLNILKHSAFCQKYMGQYPVHILSFKDISGETFESTLHAFASTVGYSARSCSFLADSPNLLPEEKETFNRYCSFDWQDSESLQTEGQFFLADMVKFLSKHFGRQVVLLIDEYDVPLAKSADKEYYGKMLEFIRKLFGNAFKPQPTLKFDRVPYLKKAVLTGCLPVSKESIFADVNDFDFNTICSEDKTLNEVVGFNEEEVRDLLQYFGLDGRSHDVQHWYDGYCFAGSKIYCPWDIINFCDKAPRSQNPAQYRPESYWESTSGNAVIDEFLSFLSAEDTDLMQTLVDGGEIELTINDKLRYRDIAQHNAQDFWTLLLYTGYLTVVKCLSPLNRYRVRIPNDEIRYCFIYKVKSRFSRANKKFVSHGKDFVKAALEGDCDTMANVLATLLDNYVSVGNTSTEVPSEKYYYELLVALLECGGVYVKEDLSNMGVGNGYSSFVFTMGAGSKRVGVVMELKICTNPHDMYAIADAAVNKIQDYSYITYLDRLRCGKKCVYGIAFCRKDCAISGGVLL